MLARIAFLCLVLVAALRVPEAVGQTTAPGTTESLIGFNDRSVSNISLTGSANDLWMALEMHLLSAPTEHGLDLWRYNTTTGTPVLTHLQDFPELVDDGMYPTVVTAPNDPEVHVVGKENANQTEAHLKVYNQDRDDFSQSPSFGPVTPSNTGYEHSKPHIAHEPALGELFLCWTRKDSNDEDVWSKAKDASTWLASTDRSVPPTGDGDVQDHCMMAFHVDGKRYLVYHSGEPTTGHIRMKVTSWDGTTWTNESDFELSGSTGADFPSIWTRHLTTTSHVLVVAKGLGNNPLVWECTGTSTSCNGAAEFGSSTAALTGGGVYDPKIFTAPRGTATDTFIVYQTVDATDRVRIAKRCGLLGTWTDVGPLPLPSFFPPYNQFTDTVLGLSRSSSQPSVFWDGFEFWVGFLAEDPTVNTIYEPMLYHASPFDFCP